MKTAITIVFFSITLAGCADHQRKKAHDQWVKELESKQVSGQWEKDREYAEAAEQRKKEEEEAKQRQREFRKNAGQRNAVKIKAIGLPASFINSTIQINTFGWNEFMTTSQWLGLILENKKISSIDATSFRGNPGVIIKRQGQPGFFIFFKIEGKEAFPHALGINNQFTIITTQQEHMSVAMTLSRLTNEAAMD
jgi:outer membrane murein-binding lipoprotein Lpp